MKQVRRFWDVSEVEKGSERKGKCHRRYRLDGDQLSSTKVWSSSFRDENKGVKSTGRRQHKLNWQDIYGMEAVGLSYYYGEMFANAGEFFLWKRGRPDCRRRWLSERDKVARFKVLFSDSLREEDLRCLRGEVSLSWGFEENARML